MGTRQNASRPGSPAHEIAITEAAVRTCGRLLAAMAGRVMTHAARDGGLICEDRTSPARPQMWRIAPDGGIRPDKSYNFARGAFIAVPAPGEAFGR